MANKRTMKLATGGRRLGAAVIDSIIPFIAGIVCFVTIISASMTQPAAPGWGYEYDFDDSFGYGYGYDYGYDISGDSGTALAVFGAMMLLLLVYFVIECIFFARSQTIGKAVLGLQVVSSKDGSKIGFWKMLFREIFVKQASHVLYLGFFWILLDEKNRAWHDKILDTYVVDLHGTRALEAKSAPAKTQPAPASPAPAPKAETPAPEAVAAALKKDETPAVEAKVPEMKAAEPKSEIKISEVKAAEPKAEPAQAVEVETEVAEAPSTEAAAQIPKVEAKAPEVKTAEPKAVPAQDIKVSMSMKKEELLEAARKAGVEVGSKATKAEIIEAIEKAAK